MTNEASNKRNGQGFTRIFKASFCSVRGLVYTWRHESAFRQEILLILLVGLVLPFFSRDPLDWVLLVFASALLLIAELMNTAIEVISDRITVEHDLAIKAAKDVASAAVFISLALLVCTSVYVFFW